MYREKVMQDYKHSLAITKQCGWSFIESVIAMMVASVIVASTAEVIKSTFDSHHLFNTIHEMQSSDALIRERMVQDIRSMRSVTGKDIDISQKGIYRFRNQAGQWIAYGISKNRLYRQVNNSDFLFFSNSTTINFNVSVKTENGTSASNISDIRTVTVSFTQLYKNHSQDYRFTVRLRNL